MTYPITIVGMQDHGCASLTAMAHHVITQSHILAGGKRLLSFFPEFQGERIPITKNPTETLTDLKKQASTKKICLLASGDPLFYGIGTLAIKVLAPHHVRILPSLSCLQLAAAHIGIPWADVKVLSFHGRPLEGLIARLRGHHCAAILTDSTTTPVAIAKHLQSWDEQSWDLWVCENLAGADERITQETVASLSLKDEKTFSPLNMLFIRRQGEEKQAQIIPFHHDEIYEKRMPKKGLITKKEVRLFVIASLNLKRTSIVWDIGAGSGAVGIDASMIAQDGHVYAIEGDERTLPFLQKNRHTHGADNLHLHEGWAPDALEALPPPDAVFIGGSKGKLDAIMTKSFASLAYGGTLVVAAITMENVAQAYQSSQNLDAQTTITLVSGARGRPLAHYTRYDALNPVHIFALKKQSPHQERKAS